MAFDASLLLAKESGLSKTRRKGGTFFRTASYDLLHDLVDCSKVTKESDRFKLTVKLIGALVDTFLSTLAAAPDSNPYKAEFPVSIEELGEAYDYNTVHVCFQPEKPHPKRPAHTVPGLRTFIRTHLAFLKGTKILPNNPNSIDYGFFEDDDVDCPPEAEPSGATRGRPRGRRRRPSATPGATNEDSQIDGAVPTKGPLKRRLSGSVDRGGRAFKRPRRSRGGGGGTGGDNVEGDSAPPTVDAAPGVGSAPPAQDTAEPQVSLPATDSGPPQERVREGPYLILEVETTCPHHGSEVSKHYHFAHDCVCEAREQLQDCFAYINLDPSFRPYLTDAQLPKCFRDWKHRLPQFDPNLHTGA